MRSILKNEDNNTVQELANKLNEAFISVMMSRWQDEWQLCSVDVHFVAPENFIISQKPTTCFSLMFE
jgi:hypothetical protein